MKKSTVSKLLSMTLALSMTLGSGSMAVFADSEDAAAEVETVSVVEEDAETAVSEDAAAGKTEVVTETAATEAEVETVVQTEAEEAAPAEMEESEEVTVETQAAAGMEIDVTAEEETEQTKAVLEGAEEVTEAMLSTSIGGVTYFYADTTDDDAATVYQATVRSRAGSTVYNFTKADLTQVGETDYYYGVVTGVTPLTGTLYAYENGTATTYKEVYGGLGVETDDSYDVISSATNYSGHHAKDIPSLVTYGTDAEGNKAITGLTLGRSMKTVDAVAYIEASILKAAGETLTEEQEAVAAAVLKTNPMNAPLETVIKPVLASAAYTSSRYGTGEFAIVPDDTVEGYVWSEYWNRVYAATISDGTTTVSAVHWIDMYGEAATSGPHYNKLEIALNNGQSKGSNAADVSRYAAFYDENRKVKDGTYTIKVYAEGYDVLEATVEITETADRAAAANAEALIKAANGTFATAAEAQKAVDAAKAAFDALTDVQKAILLASMSDAESQLAKAQTAATAQKTAEDKTAAEKKNDNSTDNKKQTVIKQTVTKQSQSLKKLTPVTKKLKASKLKKKKQTFKLKATVNGQGKVTFKKVSGNKKIKISKAGKVTVKKGLKKGTYKVKVKVSIAATGNYTAAETTKTIKIKVK